MLFIAPQRLGGVCGYFLTCTSGNTCTLCEHIFILIEISKGTGRGSDREAAGQAGLKLARVLDLYLNSRTYNTYNSGR